MGPSIEIGLPLGFRLEADALYKHARQDRFSGPAPTATLDQQGTRLGIWEIPLLIKRRFSSRRVQPFVVAGSTMRLIRDFDIDLLQIPTFPNFPAVRQRRTVSSGEPLRYGITAGGGLSWRAGVLRFDPELRYTHWTSHHWMATNEQVEFLLGVSFPAGRRD